MKTIREALREVKQAVLTMLEESDHLDYSVCHTTDRSGGAITVSHSSDMSRTPLFRINFSAVEGDEGVIAIWNVKYDGFKTLCPNSGTVYKSLTMHSITAAFLKRVTEIIEDADNGNAIRGAA